MYRQWRYGNLTVFKIAVVRQLGLVWRDWDHPRWSLSLYRCAKFGWNRCSSLDNMKLSIFRPFGLKTPIHAPKIGVLGCITSKMGSNINETPKRHKLPVGYSCLHLCSTGAILRARQSTRLLLWQFVWRQWDPRLGLQASSQPSRETPRLEWLYQPCLRAGIPVQKEQAGLVQKAGKRHNGCTVSLGVLLGLVHHIVHHSGQLVGLRDSRQSRSRSCCRTNCRQKIS